MKVKSIDSTTFCNDTLGITLPNQAGYRFNLNDMIKSSLTKIQKEIKDFSKLWLDWKKNITTYTWHDFVINYETKYINDAQSRLARIRLNDLETPDFNFNLLYSLSTSTIINLILMQKSNPKLISVLSRSKCLISDEIYILATKDMNNYTKTHQAKIELKQLWCELHNLVGYRTLPYPGFDPEAEAIRLAEGGTSTIPDNVFEATCSFLLHSCEPKPNYQTLEEYIIDQKWSTTGSSSIGKVEGSYKGEDFKYKARKNDIQHLFSLEEIMIILKEWEGIQINTASVKEETGKLRLFVAGDTVSYLYAAWLSSCASTYWKQVPFNWIDATLEDVEEELTLLKSLLRQHFSVPFDFAEFDHQPLIVQVTMIIFMFISIAGISVPSIFLSSYSHAYIVTRIAKLLITGGLPSGNFFTSLVGNMFNMICQVIISAILRKAPTYIKCRGDDSLLIFEKQEDAENHLIAASVINIGMGKGKFSIQYEATEFLRVWHTIDKSSGYIARSIVGLSQRKPWSSEPYQAFSLVLSQIEANNGCLLRGGSDYTNIILRIFQKQFSDNRMLFGQLGNGLPVISSKYRIKYMTSRIKMPELEMRMDSLAMRYPVDHDYVDIDYYALNKDHFESTLVLSYIPGIFRDLKKNTIKDVRNSKIVSQKYDNFNLISIPISILNIDTGFLYRYELVAKQTKYNKKKMSFNECCKIIDYNLFTNIRIYTNRNFTKQCSLYYLDQKFPIPNSFVVPSILRSSISHWLFLMARANNIIIKNQTTLTSFVHSALKKLIYQADFRDLINKFTT